MISMRESVGISLVLALLCLGEAAQATINIETVRISDPGNAVDTMSCAACHSPKSTAGYGSVGYTYNVGKYEVTAAQYTAFLNAVAATDTYGLYNPNMWSFTLNKYEEGCRIQRSGSSGSYSYSVEADYANRPMHWVSFWRAVRFANWLHNGQPTGLQDASTTEDGAYLIDGYNDVFGQTIVRKPGAKWFIPTEDEWYKAAYYKGHGTNAGYWRYPTCSDTMPGRDLNDPDGNNANYCDHGRAVTYGTYPIDDGKPYTVVGQFRNSPSPYGTFDQGGNAWEWNETIFSQTADATFRGIRGGGEGCQCRIIDIGRDMNAGHRSSMVPSELWGPSQHQLIGFRVAAAYDGPKITSVTPSSGIANSTVKFQILGENFFPGIDVRLTKYEQSDIVPNFTYVSPTQIDCTVDLSNMAIGRWNVVLLDALGVCDVLANGYTVLTALSSAKHAAEAVSASVDCVVTYVVSTVLFYVESDDRSCGIMIRKQSHGASVGQRISATGAARTLASGEKYLYATGLTSSGTGTVEPMVLSNKKIGGGDWFYDPSSGAGQKGMMEYRLVQTGGSSVLQLLDCPGMNNIGLLVTTFGKVTYSTSGYFYVDDGSGCRDNSTHIGVKVLGTVPGANPVGKYVKVTGVASCFKGTAPDTSLYRQIYAREVTVIQ